VERGFDPLPFLAAGELQRHCAKWELLQQEDAGIAGVAFRQEGLLAQGAELALRRLEADHPAHRADGGMLDFEPGVPRLVPERGRDLLLDLGLVILTVLFFVILMVGVALDLVMFVIGDPGAEAHAIDPGEGGTIFATDVEAIASQLHERRKMLLFLMLVIVVVIVIVSLLLVMAAAVEARSMRVAILIFVAVAGQAIFAALARIGDAEIAVASDPGSADRDVGGVVERTGHAARLEVR